MSKLQNVGVREFRDHATKYLSGSDPVAVSKHGQVIGFYIPIEADREQSRRAMEQLGRSVEAILSETGMTEEELSGLFDLRRPLAGIVVDASVLVVELLRRRGRELLARTELQSLVAEDQWEGARHELDKRVTWIVGQGRLEQRCRRPRRKDVTSTLRF